MTTKVHVHPTTQTFTILAGQTNRIRAVARKGDDLVLTLNFVDAAGDAVDISAYTTLNFRADKAGVQQFVLTPALVGGGTGGVMTVTIADTDLDADGVHDIEVQVVGTGIKYTAVVGTIVVENTYA